MKVIALIRGDLSDMLKKKKKMSNPASDGGLNGQKSAEAIVAGRFFFSRRAER
jgi:hypothetical protein